MLLALDTATRRAGLALYDGEDVRTEITWHIKRHHTEWLAPSLEEALRRIRATMSDISAVAVTLGPGSFTGLRVAMSMAKGIAAARHLPLLGIPTLDIIAYPHLETGHPLCAMLAAGRERHAYAFYPPDATRDAPHASPPALHKIAGVADALETYEDEGIIHVVGELTAAERRFLQEKEELASRIHLLSPALSVRRPAMLAELAWQRLTRGEQDDLHTLEPIYLHISKAGSG